MLDEVLDLISKECMEQYEAVRSAGYCNMFNLTDVKFVAGRFGYDALAEVAADRDKYVVLLENFGDLMRHYGITQGRKEKQGDGKV